jgi:HD-GYP domain-containing protein (c-di-GMP phosphodiesterase class II)
MGGDEFCVILNCEERRAQEYLEAASNALVEHGEGFEIGASHGTVVLPSQASEPAQALGIADRRMYAQKSLARASAGRQSADVLLKVLSERSPDLGDHLDQVTKLSEQVALSMNMPEEDIAALLQAASLHDVGKAAIPDAILNKPGKLDEREWGFIRQHTLIGERILSAAPALAKAATLVRWSHERFDGTGYPDALSADETPLGARIIAVCDAYDAMTTSRPYRPEPMRHEEALGELERTAGSQFDPQVVAAFRAADTEALASSESAAGHKG